MTPDQLTGDRGRALKAAADFANHLVNDRRLDPHAVAWALVVVGAEMLKIGPADAGDLAFARELAAALLSVASPPASGTN